MAIYEYDGKSPQFGKNCFVADSADIIGNVTLGNNANIWYNCVVRGDVNYIEIGSGTNIQDLSILHVTKEDYPLKIGKGVTVGHHATLHGCTIGDNCLVGMGAILLDGVKVGMNSLIAAGSLLPPGKDYPDRVLIRGNPAVVIRKLTPNELSEYGNHYNEYLSISKNFLDNSKLKRIECE